MGEKIRTLALERKKLRLEIAVLEFQRQRYIQEQQAGFYGIYQHAQTSCSTESPSASRLLTLGSTNTLPTFNIFSSAAVPLPEKLMETSTEDERE